MNRAAATDKHRRSTTTEATVIPYAGLGFDMSPVTDRATELHLCRISMGPAKKSSALVQEKQLKP